MNLFKRSLTFLTAAAMAFSLTLSASAYESPFAPAEKAEPTETDKPAEIKYVLREGGTFLYNNNPERLDVEDRNSLLLLEEDVNGDVYFTSENYNGTGKRLLFGLQLRNNSGEDITVTVTNIGWLNKRDWFGQKEWTDFFKTSYGLEKYLGGDYHFTDVLSPAEYSPETYVIPDGEFIYIGGGNETASYNGITVAGTGNRWVNPDELINAAVYFKVEGPKTGVSVAYVCYTDANEPILHSERTGYVCERNGKAYWHQYVGSAPYLCAEASIYWDISDETSGKLPVRYDVDYYTDANANEIPYRRYENKETRTVFSNIWKTHLNPNWDTTYVGSDMMPFEYYTVDGEKIIIDTAGNDGSGKSSNIGNWMVIYEESMTFKNSGSVPRVFGIYMENNGFLGTHILSESGELLKAVYHTNKADPIYSLEVAPGEEKTVKLEYTNLANGYGSVTHYVTASKVRKPTQTKVSEPEEPKSEEVTESGGKKGYTLYICIAIAVILAATGGFIILKKKKKAGNE